MNGSPGPSAQNVSVHPCHPPPFKIPENCTPFFCIWACVSLKTTCSCIISEKTKQKKNKLWPYMMMYSSHLMTHMWDLIVLVPDHRLFVYFVRTFILIIPNLRFKIKRLIEKSRECHNHKPQPTTDTKRKRKMTKTNTYKANKQIHEKHTDQLPLPQAR